MKGRPASSFAHLLSVQAAVSAKQHSQANSERRGGGGGRVKDNREDELTLWTLSTRQSKPERTGKFPSWRFRLFCWDTKLFFSWCPQGKQRHWTSRTFPVLMLSSPFLFFYTFGFIPFSSQNVHPPVKARLCNPNRELFHSVPAITNTFQPVSHPWINMTVLLKNLKFYMHFFFLYFVNFFFLSCWGEGRRLTQNKNVQ